MYEVSTSCSLRVPPAKFRRAGFFVPLSLPLLFAAAVTLSCGDARAQQFLPILGGGGGSGFTAQCPEGQHLAGVELRVGAKIDAIRSVCVTAFGPAETSAPILTTGSGLVERSTGTIFNLPVLPQGWFGGTGGQIARVMCPPSKPIVIGFIGEASDETKGADREVMHKIAVFCGLAAPGQVAEAYPQASHEGELRGYYVRGEQFSQSCPANQLAIGVHGRYGDRLDAIGLICAPPRIDTSRGPGVKPRPRVIGTPSMNDAAKNICDNALIARQRNSPATAGLDAQCAAQTARQRGEQNAARERVEGLRNRAVDLAVRGAVIGLKDPVIMAMRARSGTGINAEPFNVGLAAAQSQTEWGPGKQQLAELYPVGVGLRETFMLAAEFTLDRNRNAERLAIGRPIVDADPELAAARDKNEDPRFGIGFDLATAIFGDPALGAQGNTELGPGSLGLRAALSHMGKLGFDAAVALHLSRTYR